MGGHCGCWTSAHHNQIGTAMPCEIDNRGFRSCTGEASTKPCAFSEKLRSIVVKRFFERYPVHVFFFAALLHMNQNQLCSILGSQFMRKSHHLCRTRLETGRTDHLAERPYL